MRNPHGVSLMDGQKRSTVLRDRNEDLKAFRY